MGKACIQKKNSSGKFLSNFKSILNPGVNKISTLTVDGFFRYVQNIYRIKCLLRQTEALKTF